MTLFTAIKKWLHAETKQTSKVSISDEEYDAVRRPILQRTSYDPAAPVYAVGDTVYILHLRREERRFFAAPSSAFSFCLYPCLLPVRTG